MSWVGDKPVAFRSVIGTRWHDRDDRQIGMVTYPLLDCCDEKQMTEEPTTGLFVEREILSEAALFNVLEAINTQHPYYLFGTADKSPRETPTELFGCRHLPFKFDEKSEVHHCPERLIMDEFQLPMDLICHDPASAAEDWKKRFRRSTWINDPIMLDTKIYDETDMPQLHLFGCAIEATIWVVWSIEVGNKSLWLSLKLGREIGRFCIVLYAYWKKGGSGADSVPPELDFSVVHLNTPSIECEQSSLSGFGSESMCFRTLELASGMTVPFYAMQNKRDDVTPKLSINVCVNDDTVSFPELHIDQKGDKGTLAIKVPKGVNHKLFSDIATLLGSKDPVSDKRGRAKMKRHFNWDQVQECIVGEGYNTRFAVLRMGLDESYKTEVLSCDTCTCNINTDIVEIGEGLTRRPTYDEVGGSVYLKVFCDLRMHRRYYTRVYPEGNDQFQKNCCLWIPVTSDGSNDVGFCQWRGISNEQKEKAELEEEEAEVNEAMKALGVDVSLLGYDTAAYSRMVKRRADVIEKNLKDMESKHIPMYMVMRPIVERLYVELASIAHSIWNLEMNGSASGKEMSDVRNLKEMYARFNEPPVKDVWKAAETSKKGSIPIRYDHIRSVLNEKKGLQIPIMNMFTDSPPGSDIHPYTSEATKPALILYELRRMEESVSNTTHFALKSSREIKFMFVCSDFMVTVTSTNDEFTIYRTDPCSFIVDEMDHRHIEKGRLLHATYNIKHEVLIALYNVDDVVWLRPFKVSGPMISGDGEKIDSVKTVAGIVNVSMNYVAVKCDDCDDMIWRITEDGMRLVEAPGSFCQVKNVPGLKEFMKVRDAHAYFDRGLVKRLGPCRTDRNKWKVSTVPTSLPIVPVRFNITTIEATPVQDPWVTPRLARDVGTSMWDVERVLVQYVPVLVVHAESIVTWSNDHFVMYKPSVAEKMIDGMIANFYTRCIKSISLFSLELYARRYLPDQSVRVFTFVDINGGFAEYLDMIFGTNISSVVVKGVITALGCFDSHTFLIVYINEYQADVMRAVDFTNQQCVWIGAYSKEAANIFIDTHTSKRPTAIEYVQYPGNKIAWDSEQARGFRERIWTNLESHPETDAISKVKEMVANFLLFARFRDMSGATLMRFRPA